ncbi:MAG: VanZ family protein [Candidatus Zixiibacteriota bacterium]
MRRKLPFILSIIVLIGVVYVLDGINIPTQSRLWREVTNAGHAPLFGVLSIAMLVFANSLMRRSTEPFHYYLAAGIVSSFLGALTEFIQYFTPRDASVLDMIYNELGITAFLLLAATFDSRMQKYPSFRNFAGRNVIRATALIILAGAFISFATIALAHAHRKVQFPVICDFDSYLDRNFVVGANARIEFVDPPISWAGNKSPGAAKWSSDGKRLSAFTIQYPYPIWTGYQKFSLEIFSEAEKELLVFLRINDVSHNFEFDDRYNKELTIAPGVNRFVIPILEIEETPGGRQMDLTSIASIILFTSGGQEPHAIFVDNIRLE